MITFVSLGLSQNPQALLTEDSKYNLTSDGRRYLIAKFRDPSNPFASIRTRVISESSSVDSATGVVTTKWAVEPALLRPFIGKNIEGNIVTADVEPYDVNGNTVTQYTAVVFKHESAAKVFLSQKHPMVGTATAEPIAVDSVATETAELSIGGNPQS